MFDMMNTMQSWQSTNKTGVEAATHSATAVAKGAQAALVEMTDGSKVGFEMTASAAEKLMSARSLDKAVEVQTEYMRDAYEAMIGRATKLGEIYSDAMRDATKPFEAAVQTAHAPKV